MSRRSALERLADQIEEIESRAHQLYSELEAPLKAGDVAAVRNLLPADIPYAVGLVFERLAHEGHAAGVDLLLECGVEPGWMNWDDDACLLSAAAGAGLRDAVAKIWTRLEGREDRDAHRALALAAAAGEGHLAVVEDLLEADALDEVVLCDALYAAACGGHEDVVDLLTPHADPGVREEIAKALAAGKKRRECRRPATTDPGALKFFDAVEDERLEEAQRLVSGGAIDLHAVDSGGLSIAHHSIYHPELMEAVIAAGAPLDIQDQEGQTVLMYAVREEDSQLLRHLIDAGANLNLRDVEGRSAVDLAVDSGAVAQLQLLVQAGADCCGADPNDLALKARESLQEQADAMQEGLAALSELCDAFGDDESADELAQLGDQFDSLESIAVAEQPDRIDLERLEESFTHAPMASAAVQQLSALGFEPAGTFAIAQMPGVLVTGFADPARRLYAAVYDHEQVGVWTDFVALFEDGSRLTVSNLAQPGASEPRPGTRMVFLPGTDGAQLLRATEEQCGDEPRQPASAAGFAGAFEAAHAADIAWRKRKISDPPAAS